MTRWAGLVIVAPLLVSCAGRVTPHGTGGAGGHGGSTGGGGGGGTDGGSGGGTACNGSGLQNDPTNGCAAPTPPESGCAQVTLTSQTFALPSNPYFAVPSGGFSRLDGETSIVIDQRVGQKHAYAVTINSIVAPTPRTVSNPTGSCIVGKSLSVFTWNDPMSRWDLMDGNQVLPSNSSTSGGPTVWLTDPTLAVGPDGTVFLTALRSQAASNCTTDMSEQNTVDLWFAPPGGPCNPTSRSTAAAIP